jgi:hypothetical protein
MKLKIEILIAAAVIGGVSSTAVAQTAESTVQRADFRLGRTDKPEVEPSFRDFGTAKPFQLTFTLPITYNTNVENSPTKQKQSPHFVPTLQMDWKKSEGTVRPFFRVKADSDFYTKHSDNDGATFSGRMGIKVFDPTLGKLVPYIHYSPVLIFERGFKSHQVTLHSFTAGAAGKFTLGQTELGVDFQGARREATLRNFELNRAGLTVSLSGDITPDKLSWSVDQSVNGKFYTGGTNKGRHDTNFITNAGLSWSIGTSRTVDLGVSFEHNSSNRVGKNYSAWDIGPSLGLAWKF